MFIISVVYVKIDSISTAVYIVSEEFIILFTIKFLSNLIFHTSVYLNWEKSQACRLGLNVKCKKVECEIKCEMSGIAYRGVMSGQRLFWSTRIRDKILIRWGFADKPQFFGLCISALTIKPALRD